jgi:hypothetical protein
MRKKTLCGAIVVVALLAMGFTGLSLGQEPEIQMGKIYLETYPLLTQTDLYCSFFILDGPLPKLKIIGAERDEINLHTNGEVVYLSAGKDQGLGADQVFLILEPGGKVNHPLKGKSYEPLMYRRGRAKVIYADKDKAAARIEGACGQVTVGSFLVPFELKTTVEGKDQGYVPYQDPSKALSGTVIFLIDALNQVSFGDWVLIDIGREAGLKVGQQMTVFRPADEKFPRRSVGNGVVMDVQAKTSTLKLLATDDVVRRGDGVELK